MAAGAVVVGGPAAVGALTLASRAWVVARSRGRVVRSADPGALERLTWAPVAAVLGAGLRADGTPTNLLARRVAGGVMLWRVGLVDRLVMSGAVVGPWDEPAAMARLAQVMGVPPQHIARDPTGVDTAATCRHLRDQGRGPVILVTQEFHIHRTLYLAARAGLDAVGWATPDAEVRPAPLAAARARELPAAVKAIFVDRF